ncbi:hypothetical protein PS15m_008071 [Mucor circinelloides]
MFNYRRDFSISSNNNRSNSSSDGNQNAYFQRSILDAIKAVNDNCNKRLDSLELKLESFMQQVMQQNAPPSIEPAFSDHFPLAKYANQEVRRLLIKEADESQNIRDIDCLTVAQTAQSCLPVVAENVICRRLSRLMARSVYDEFGSYEAEVLTEERIGQMKKQFSAIASKINDVAHYTNASTPMKWGDVPEPDQDYSCMVLEHLTQVEQMIPPGKVGCTSRDTLHIKKH